MITAHFEDEEIKATGQVLDGEKYPDFCCQGFNWAVRHIFPDKTPGYNSIWGCCDNPDCPDYQKDIGPSDPYRGISSICQEDFEEWLATRSPNNNFLPDRTTNAVNPTPHGGG